MLEYSHLENWSKVDKGFLYYSDKTKSAFQLDLPLTLKACQI